MSAIGRDVVEPGGAGDGEPVRVEGAQLVEADLVEVRRLQVEAGPGPDRHPVPGGAVRRRPEPRVHPRRREVGAAERVAVAQAAPGSRCPARPPRRARAPRRRPRPAAPRSRSATPRPGPASMRSACEIVRSATTRGAVIPVERPSSRRSRCASTNGANAARRARSFARRSGVSAALELDPLGQKRLRPVDLIDERDEIHPQVVRLVAQLAHHPQHVVGDPLLDREAVDRDGGKLGKGPLAERARGRPPRRGRVGEAVVVALVAVDRADLGVEAQVRLPEPVREGVDGGAGLERDHRSSGRWRWGFDRRAQPGEHRRRRGCAGGASRGAGRRRGSAGCRTRRLRAPRARRGAARSRAARSCRRGPARARRCSDRSRSLRRWGGSRPRPWSRRPSGATSRMHGGPCRRRAGRPAGPGCRACRIVPPRSGRGPPRRPPAPCTGPSPPRRPCPGASSPGSGRRGAPGAPSRGPAGSGGPGRLRGRWWWPRSSTCGWAGRRR